MHAIPWRGISDCRRSRRILVFLMKRHRFKAERSEELDNEGALVGTAKIFSLYLSSHRTACWCLRQPDQ